MGKEVDFTDTGGVAWVVREDGAGLELVDSIGGATGCWLRFESELEVRRLWTYPDDWRSLRPEQLSELSRRASVVIVRFRRPTEVVGSSFGTKH